MAARAARFGFDLCGRRALALAVGLWGASFMAAAPAQDAGKAPTKGSVLDEIVVTAQKREQNLKDVPIAVSAYSGDKIDELGTRELSDFLQTSPGVTISGENRDQQIISIRGLNPSFGDPAVGYYMDEMSWGKIGNADVPDVRTYDLERVEILRGPQGTLYGGGSIGGVVRILTKDPVLDQFQVKVDLTGSKTSGSDENNSAIKGAVNVPMGDKVALRLSGSKEKIPGWIDDSITGQKDVNDRDAQTYRGKLRYAANDDLNFLVGLWSYKSDGGFVPSFRDRTTDRALSTFGTDYDIYTLTADYNFGNVQMVSATAVMDYTAKAASAFPPFGSLGTVDNQDLLSQELRFVSVSEGRFYWTAGLFYRDIKRAASGGIPGIFTFGQTETSKTWAVFGEGTWRFLDDKLEATIGLRFFGDKRHQVDQVNGLPPVDGKFHTISPRFNLAYKPNDNWMMYANAGRGFRSGLTQAATSIFSAALFGIVAPPSVDPEIAWSYEVGAKGNALDGRLSLEAYVYYITWQNLQLAVAPDPTAPVASFLVNAGDARSQGFEGAANFRAADWLTLQVGFSSINPEFTDNVVGINIVKGQKISNVPEITWNASALIQHDLTASLAGFARVGVQFIGRQTDQINRLMPSDTRTLLDARVGVQSKHWGAYLFGSNLTDVKTQLGPVANPAGLSGRDVPRTIGLNLRYSY